MSSKIVMPLTLASLERILGGDAEVELKVRDQIAQQFAKAHLSKILDQHPAKKPCGT
jgi:hypothetical protein